MGFLRKCGNAFCRTWFREMLFTFIPTAVMALVVVLMFAWQEQHETIGRRILYRHSLPPLADTIRGYMEHVILEADMIHNLYHSGTLNDPADGFTEASLIVPYIWSLSRGVPWSGMFYHTRLVPEPNTSVSYELQANGVVVAHRQHFRAAGAHIRRREPGIRFQHCAVAVDPTDSLHRRHIALPVLNSETPTQQWVVDKEGIDRSPQLRFSVLWRGDCVAQCPAVAASPLLCDCTPTTSQLALRYNQEAINHLLIGDPVCSRTGLQNCSIFVPEDELSQLHVFLLLTNVGIGEAPAVLAYNGVQAGTQTLAAYTPRPLSSTVYGGLLERINSPETDAELNFTIGTEYFGRLDRVLDGGGMVLLSLVSQEHSHGSWESHADVLRHVRRILSEQETQVAGSIIAAVEGGLVMSVDDWEELQHLMYTTLLMQEELVENIVLRRFIPVKNETSGAQSNVASDTTLFLLSADGELETVSLFEQDEYMSTRTRFLTPQQRSSFGDGLRGEMWADVVIDPSLTGGLASSINHQYQQHIQSLTHGIDIVRFDGSSGLLNGTRVVFSSATQVNLSCGLGSHVLGEWFRSDAELRGLLFNIGMEQSAADVAVITSDGTLLGSSGERVPGATGTKVWEISVPFGALSESMVTNLDGIFAGSCDGDHGGIICDLDARRIIAVSFQFPTGPLTTFKVDIARIGSVGGLELYLMMRLPGAILTTTTYIEKATLVGAVIFTFIFLLVNIVGVIYTTVTVTEIKSLLKDVACGCPEKVNPAQYSLSSNNEVRELQQAAFKVRSSLIEFKSFVPSVVFDGSSGGRRAPGLLASAVYEEASRRVGGSDDDQEDTTPITVHPRNASIRNKTLVVLRVCILAAEEMQRTMGPSAFAALHGRIMDVVRACTSSAGATIGTITPSNIDCFWSSENTGFPPVTQLAAEACNKLNKTAIMWMSQGIAPPLRMAIIAASGSAFSGFVGPSTDRTFIIGGDLMLKLSAMDRTVTLLHSKGGTTLLTGLRKVTVPISPCLALCDHQSAHADQHGISVLPLGHPTMESPWLILHACTENETPQVRQYTSRYLEALRLLAEGDKVAADSFLTQFCALAAASGHIQDGHPLIEYLRESIQNIS